jgi:hypothetical protein
VPVTYRTATDWLRAAEKLAGLDPLPHGAFHPFRRRWASERKHLPLSDVAAAGGWVETTTLQRCYISADEETLEAVVLTPKRLGRSSGKRRCQRQQQSARPSAGRFSFRPVQLVQYWFSMDGEKAVLTRSEYPGISAKSLCCGETTIRKAELEVPMDHLLGCRWNTYCRREW